MSEFTVHDQPDFERVYDEDETMTIRRGDLRALLDVATMSMDFGSGFMDNEQVEILRKTATALGIDPMLATPPNFTCLYSTGEHEWRESTIGPADFGGSTDLKVYCWKCHTIRGSHEGAGHEWLPVDWPVVYEKTSREGWRNLYGEYLDEAKFAEAEEKMHIRWFCPVCRHTSTSVDKPEPHGYA